MGCSQRIRCLQERRTRARVLLARRIALLSWQDYLAAFLPARRRAKASTEWRQDLAA